MEAVNDTERAMEKFFNVAGPCHPAKHYMLPATERLPDVMRLIRQEQYFAIHAARQSGKTTLMQGLVRDINASGERVALYFTVESVMAYPDPHDGIVKIVERMRGDLLRHPLFGELVRDPNAPIPQLLPQPPDMGVKVLLSLLAEKAGKPLVVFFDEVDGLTEGTAVTFLRELRDGYITRETVPFPSSVAICGMMDIRDMKAKVRPHSDTLGSKSPFNVIAEDFTLRNFTKEEVERLYAQHTAATGQVFESGALDLVWEYTQGQPWLVNALARECVEKIHNGDDSSPITAKDVATAKETIIRRDPIHLFYLFDMMKNPRIEPFFRDAISGKALNSETDVEAFNFFKALGLFCKDGTKWFFSNPIYAASWERRSGL